MRKRYLLGISKDGELAFGEMELYTWSHKPEEFAASFELVRPFNYTNTVDEDFISDWLEDIDKETKFDWCEEGGCSPQELPTYLLEKYGPDGWSEAPDMFLDCSLYPEDIFIGEDTWKFESISCGQIEDIADRMETYINKELFDRLIDFWKKYHLQKLDSQQLAEAEQLMEDFRAFYADVDEYTFAADFCKKIAGEEEEVDEDEDAE